MPVGADVQATGTYFRVWAPGRSHVELVLGPSDRCLPLVREPDGYFGGFAAGVAAGGRYGFRLAGETRILADPASRFQPDGPHGRSQVVDPDAFSWTDGAWQGVRLPGQVLYELHVGTFTRAGSWQAARDALPQLKELGVTLVEVMPVADFPGHFGWGYDGVNLFAPTRLYGPHPDDFRAFVDAAHALGLGVLLDVVYNHLGPDGNELAHFAPAYFTDRYVNDWGTPLNFDGPDAGPVRELILANAAYWIREFHLDGLRLDATQAVFDDESRGEHLIAAIARTVRTAGGTRHTLVIGENEPQDTRLLHPVNVGGFGLDALWNDDFHHTATVALTGRAEAYYSDHRGTPQEFISAAKQGFLFQGQRYAWQSQRRGTPATDLPPAAFVTFLQNHDQVANSALGLRVHRLASPGTYRAMTALLLLLPGTPMLFQGQEWAASSPFLYFADQPPELAAQVRQGRDAFLAQFPGLAQPDVQQYFADPAHPDTFERSKLDHAERTHAGHAQALALHRDLLQLRHSDAAFHAQQPGAVDGAVLGPAAFVLRFVAARGDDRLLVVNLGADLQLDRVPEPLLAPPLRHRWRLHWSSEDPRYGGIGAAAPEDALGQWRLPGMVASVLAPTPQRPGDPA
jgi:maltooligosyltrehalose trehalohydrolase